MNNPFKQFFARIRDTVRKVTRYKEFGGYVSKFFSFGKDINRSEIVRSCIRPLADQTSKAYPICKDDKLRRLLEYYPNQFMNGKDFLYKVRTLYEIHNTAFVIIIRDRNGLQGFYPMTYKSFEALEDVNGFVYLKFITAKGNYIFLLDDVIILRKDYNKYDIAGDENEAILNTLELIKTSDQSISNAVKSTANLRGILKSTKTMMDPDDLKKIKDRFVEDYMDAEKGDGVGALDATTEFIQTNMSPTITSWETMKNFREDVYRYFGVNDNIVMSKATPEEMHTFYELKIEPFLIALSQEMTRKMFTAREIAQGNFIKWNSSTIQFMSMADKMALKEYIDRGALTPNEWREIVGFDPIEGGDTPIRRLDTAPIEEVTNE